MTTCASVFHIFILPQIETTDVEPVLMTLIPRVLILLNDLTVALLDDGREWDLLPSLLHLARRRPAYVFLRLDLDQLQILGQHDLAVVLRT